MKASSSFPPIAGPSTGTTPRHPRRCTSIFAILLVETVLLGGSLTGCAANTVSQGPVQGPVPIPKTTTSRRAPEPPPVRERQPPPAAPETAPREGPQAPASGAEEPVSEASPDRAQLALLQSTLWIQTAEEYRGSALQAYRLARRNLETALADDTWSATSERADAGDSTKPPAIVLDVDETVLDNSPFEARRILTKTPSFREAWYRWCREAAAEAVPGALELTRYATSRGVAVFYISNRDHVLEDATRGNLERLGFPLGKEQDDRILTRHERPDWGSEKESRRQFVAKSYRILLMIGDDFGDFVTGSRSGRKERKELFDLYQERWGRQWILLPNPTYGSWERALFEGEEDLSDDEKLEIKLRALDSKP